MGQIICSVVGASGTPCGATAVVLKAHYRFEPAPVWATGVARVLTEVSFDIQCPRCGCHTQRESVEPTNVLGR